MNTTSKITRIGITLARFREKAHLSQQALADAMRTRGHKWTPITVLNIEHGTRQLKLIEACDVAELLGVTVQALCEGGATYEKEREMVSCIDSLAETFQTVTKQASLYASQYDHLFSLLRQSEYAAAFVRVSPDGWEQIPSPSQLSDEVVRMVARPLDQAQE